eukprot:CAMPEP_0173440650 /NCGR_PEP_ID=MMETSP1357-20121228/23329_1 /TAXON_ID=77926 /ORGANISM="Hemiselmis rufescens, Strain PCC563" /LENGTH=375 /DNA_ID=CAMNT_0014406159 /DNA_START=60 /DNA_END=1187 /DNA_ORIENTATION=+
MGFSCFGFQCGSVPIEPVAMGSEMIQKQLDEVIKKLRARGGGPIAGEAVNRCIAHCIESDLSPAQQLDVLEALEFTKLCELDIALMERHVGACLLVTQAMMAAIVPILIPFSEVYKEEQINGLNVGMILSIVATSCSLLGSICMAIEKARKFQETSYVGHDAAWNIYKEIQLFLSLAGPYKEFNSHKGGAWKKYAEELANLEQARDSRKNNVYGSSQAQAGVEVGKAQAANAAAGAALPGGLPGIASMGGLLEGGQSGMMSMMEQGQAAVQQGVQQAQGQVQGAVSSAQGAAQTAQNQAQGAVQNAQNQAQGAVQGAQGQVQGAVQGAQGAVQGAQQQAADAGAGVAQAAGQAGQNAQNAANNAANNAAGNLPPI